MTEIENRVESTKGAYGGRDYVERAFSAEEIAAGVHRQYVGGHWDTHGKHQLDFLVGEGLRPDHRFLDVGCGCFRAGRYLIDYLEPEHYYGIDANLSVLTVGYDVELSAEQRRRVPTSHLFANDRFNTDFGGVRFDMAIAQSVFTHVSLNHIRLCLYRVAKVMNPGATFYATFMVKAPNTPLDKLRPGATTRFTERNPFWYYQADLLWAARVAPWRVRYIGDWGHPSGQVMMAFTRLDETEEAGWKKRRRKRRKRDQTGAVSGSG